MSIWNQVFRPNVERRVAAWAIEVARQTQVDVADRLNGSISRMSLPEARGYIRARSGDVIDAEIAAMTQSRRLETAFADAVRERAIEETIRLAIGDLLRASRRVEPQTQATVLPIRKAA